MIVGAQCLASHVAQLASVCVTAQAWSRTSILFMNASGAVRTAILQIRFWIAVQSLSWLAGWSEMSF